MPKANTTCPPNSSTLLAGSLPAQLHRAVKWLLDSSSWKALAPHGNTSWTFSELLLLALFWVWSDAATLTGAFAHARHLAGTLLGKVALTSYTGFAGSLDTWTTALMPRLRAILHQRMESVAGTHWRIGGWLPLALDGSRTSAPRTKANEAKLCPRRWGRGAKAKSRASWKNKRRRSKRLSQPVRPQAWLTLVWHMGLRMPWAWRCGPSNASERQHATEMLEAEDFPEKTLFCADAGFVGHDLWQAMAGRGHHFLIRVGANVRLLRGLGRVKRHGCDIVHFWPRHVAARNRSPMVLRLLKFQVGRCAMHAVTNVLSERALSAAQAVRLYRARWGVEVQFRTLKQTFGRARLHSRTPERVLRELEWSLVGLWLVQLLAAAEQIPAGIAPERTSVSVALQVFRDAMGCGRAWGLKRSLREAKTDAYERTRPKKSRHRTPFKDRPSAKRPRVERATAEERRKYKTLNG